MAYESKPGKLIIAASGTGKTYFVKHNLNWIDFDAYVFLSFISDKQNEDCRWLKTYKDYYGYNIITNSSILPLLCRKTNIKIDYIIIPSLQMKDEIIARVNKRDGAEADWSKVYCHEYETLFKRFSSWPFPKIYLKPGQYVSDVLDEEGNPKEGVEVIYPD